MVQTVSATELSRNQQRCIELAYKHGNRITFNGDNFGETVAAMLFQESKANYKKYQKNGVVMGDGTHKGFPKSMGPMQVQLATARDIEKWYPTLFKLKFGPHSPTDKELVHELLNDVEFNIQCGAAYFQKMLEVKRDYKRAILAYNRGPGDPVDKYDYVNKVLHWREAVVLPHLKFAGLI